MIDLQTMKPVNKTAALVTSQGVNYNYLEKKSTKQFTTKMKPPTRLLKKNETLNPNIVNYTGLKYGKMEVVGLYAESFNWVVNCDCGNYEIRRVKSVRKASAGDMCEQCKDIREVRRKAFFLTNGYTKEEL